MKRNTGTIPRIQILNEPEFGAGTLTREGLLRRGAGLGAGLILGGAVPATAFAKTAPPKPTVGGNFILGVNGTPTGMDLDPIGGTQGGEINIALREMFFERLTKVAPNGKILPWLATEFSANSTSTVWKISLREGVVWHDGSPFTADDVVWSLSYILDTPSASATGTIASLVASSSDIVKIDALHVQLNLIAPLVFLPQIFSELRVFIVKNGQSSPFNPPIGTGPFVFSNWTQGQQITGTRNPHYWQHGKPYVDTFQAVIITDPTARLEALQSGQVHALSQLSPSNVSTVQSDSSLKLLAHSGGTWGGFAMQATIPPFDDVNVRQAMKYLVQRPQMLGDAMGSAGVIANDLQNAIDPDRATFKQIPQRVYDPEMAQSLLNGAGQSNFSIPLSASSTIGDYSTQLATVFASQVQEANIGATITLDFVSSAVYEASRYEKAPFVVVFWSARYLDEYISESLIPGVPLNTETNWSDPSFTSLWMQYRAEANAGKRDDLAVELQQILYDQGPYVIPCFEDLLDAYSAKVGGIESGLIRDFNLYDFRSAYFIA